jgi:hypothetical protein
MTRVRRSGVPGTVESAIGNRFPGNRTLALKKDPRRLVRVSPEIIGVARPDGIG